MTGDRGHFPAAVGDLPGTLHCTRKIERALAFHVTRTSPKPFLAPALLTMYYVMLSSFFYLCICPLYNFLEFVSYIFLQQYSCCFFSSKMPQGEKPFYASKPSLKQSMMQ